MIKKLLLSAVLGFFVLQSNSQEYNKWSIGFGGGLHEIINPLSPGYETGPLSFGQANLGVRYMFNNKFGLMVDFGYNEFKEGDNSLPFRANYYRANLEGVVNAGNLLDFNSWTNRINLLFHGGIGLSNATTLSPITTNGDPLLNFIVGFTPQFKINNRISLFLDLSAIFHDYQNFNYDGAPNTRDREVSASIVNTSIGVNISIGKSKENADFYVGDKIEDKIVNTELDAIKKRLSSAEKEIEILKSKESGPNKEIVLTELDERYIKRDEANKYSSVVTGSNVDFIRELLNSGYINVYFDVNKDEIQKGSLNSVNYLKQFMMDNPTVNADLIGYADETGTEARNKTLSQNRAKRVYDVLIAAGISPARLSYFGGGEDKSVTEDARQFARKVTFKLK